MKEEKQLERSKKDLIKTFKEMCKYSESKYDKEIIDYVIEVINSVNNRQDFKFLNEHFYLIKSNMPNKEQKNLYNTYKSLLNIIRRRFNKNQSEYLITYNGDTVFHLLNNVPYIDLRITDTKSNSVYNTLLSNNKIQAESNILFVQKILTKTIDANYINVIFDAINSDNTYLRNILCIILRSERNLANVQSQEVILSIVNKIKKLDKKDITHTFKSNLFNLINILFQNIFVNIKVYNIDFINHVIDNLDNKNMGIIIDVMKDETFISIEDTKLQIEIINMVNKLTVTDKEFKTNIEKIITNVIAMSHDREYINYILKKLEYIKSNKSLKMLIEINPFIEKYVTNESKKEIISTLSRDSNPRKLEIILKDK